MMSADVKDICFVITPIGSPGSAERRRADRVCNEILKPALEAVEPKLELIRGDEIQEFGPITVQLVEHITDARLIVADLAVPNPNVYYELGIAEAFHKPIIRIGGDTAEALPFDVRDMRTLPLPTGKDGSIDVVDANNCQNMVIKLLPEMLADGYKPTSIVSLAQRRAAIQSFSGSMETDDTEQAAALRELAKMVLDIQGDLAEIRRALHPSVKPHAHSQASPERWADIDPGIAGRDGFISCNYCDWGAPFSPALGDKPPSACPKCGAS